MEKKSRKERIEDQIAAVIGSITPGKDKGPFYVNRAMMRGRGNKKPRYVMTAEDYKRFDAERKFVEERRKRHGNRGV